MNRKQRKIISIATALILFVMLIPVTVFAHMPVKLEPVDNVNTGSDITITGSTSLNGATVKIIQPDNNILYVDTIEGNFHKIITIPSSAPEGTYTVVAGKGQVVDKVTFQVTKSETVKYTVRYLQMKVRDRDPEVEMAEPQVFTGKLGDTITVKALDIPGWSPDEPIKTITLTEDENEIIFRYGLNTGFLLTGDGLSKDIYYTKAELEELADNNEITITRNYSVMKRGGIPAIITGKGIDLASFIEKSGIIGKGDLRILCRAIDGWVGAPLTYNTSTQSFGNLYYYPGIFNGNEQGKQLVPPMLAFYNVEDQEKVPEIPPAQGWTKVLDFPHPTLMLGQSHIEDFNNQNFAKMLFAIQVGEIPEKVLEISGEGIEKTKTYRLDQLIEKGMENKTFGTNNRQGISLSRLLLDAGADEDSQIKIQTADDTEASVSFEDASEYLLCLNINDNIIDRNAPLSVYYEKNGTETSIKNVTKLICGIHSENPNNNNEEIPIKKAKTRAIPKPKKSELDSRYFERTEEVKGANNGKIERIKIKPEVTNLLEDVPTDAVIFITSSDVNWAQLSFDGKFVEKALEKNISIKLNTPTGNYILPMSEIKLEKAAEKLSCNKNEITVNMTIAQSSLPKDNQMLTELVQFDTKLTYADKEIPWNSFEKYICHEIPLPEPVDPKTTVGAHWNKTNKKLVPMPTIFIKRNGKTFAQIYSKCSDLYTVVAQKKTLTFEDIKEHWAQEDIQLLASKLIINGRTNTSFAPESQITRAEFTAMLTRALGLKEQPLSNNFSDIKGDEWFAGSVGAATKEKLVSGFPDGTFKPKKQISRQEMAVIMANALKAIGKEESLDKTKIQRNLNRFKDNKTISNWAEAGVAITTELEIIGGMPNGCFMPLDNATRAQTAVMVSRLLKSVNLIDDSSEIAQAKDDKLFNIKQLFTEEGADYKLPENTKNMLVIEGDAVETPKAFSLSDLKAMSDGIVSGNYFSRGKDSSPNPRAHTRCTGISVYYLLTEVIDLEKTPSSITVIAEDGYRQSFPIKEVAGYYIDETNPKNNHLEMIIAWEEDGKEYSTRDGSPFRLIVGQTFPEEYNRLKWVRNVTKIVVE